jgi:hypothetical protein
MVMKGGHLSSSRAWEIITGESEVSSEEAFHLEDCEPCYAFLRQFATLAKAAGFTVHFEETELPQQKAARKSESS